MDAIVAQVICDCGALLTQRTQDMVLIPDYRPKDRRVRAAMVLKVGASSGRNPPLLARRRKLSRRFRSDAFSRPHQAGDAYSILARGWSPYRLPVGLLFSQGCYFFALLGVLRFSVSGKIAHSAHNQRKRKEERRGNE